MDLLIKVSCKRSLKEGLPAPALGSHIFALQVKNAVIISNKDDDDCFHYLKKQFSTLNGGSMTLKSTSVLLMETLCAQINSTLDRFESLVSHSHLLLFFFERKNMPKEKKHVDFTTKQLSHPAFPCIYTHVYFVRIYQYVYAEI